MRREVRVSRLEIRVSGVAPDVVSAALRALGPALRDRLRAGAAGPGETGPVTVRRGVQPAALAAGLAARVAEAAEASASGSQSGEGTPP